MHEHRICARCCKPLNCREQWMLSRRSRAVMGGFRKKRTRVLLAASCGHPCYEAVYGGGRHRRHHRRHHRHRRHRSNVTFQFHLDLFFHQSERAFSVQVHENGFEFARLNIANISSIRSNDGTIDARVVFSLKYARVRLLFSYFPSSYCALTSGMVTFSYKLLGKADY